MQPFVPLDKLFNKKLACLWENIFAFADDDKRSVINVS